QLARGCSRARSPSGSMSSRPPSSTACQWRLCATSTTATRLPSRRRGTLSCERSRGPARAHRTQQGLRQSGPPAVHGSFRRGIRSNGVDSAQRPLHPVEVTAGRWTTRLIIVGSGGSKPPAATITFLHIDSVRFPTHTGFHQSTSCCLLERIGGFVLSIEFAEARPRRRAPLQP